MAKIVYKLVGKQIAKSRSKVLKDTRIDFSLNHKLILWR